MLNHFKPSLCAACVLLLLIQVSSALGAQTAGHAEVHVVTAAARDHRKASKETRHKPGVAVHRGTYHLRAAAASVLLGDTAVEWQYDALNGGQAEAFRFKAGASGLAGAVHVYTSAGTSASTLIVGLYDSAPGRPGTLLSTGSASPDPGTWINVSIAPVELVLGRIYWLAILGRGGWARYRDRASGPCPSEMSASQHLRALPSSWRTGATYSDCPLSAYVTPVPAPLLPGSTNLASPLDDQMVPLEELVAGLPAAPTVNTLPVIVGDATQGDPLTATEGSWTGSPTSYAYQWEDCKASGEGCSEIAGATSSNYKLAAGDVGHTLRVLVTATNAGGSGKATSEATELVKAETPGAPANTVLPKVSGTAEEGHTLTATKGSWTGSPTSYAYQWEDCNTSGQACSEISGATSSNYKLTASDVGHTVRVVVTATNAGGSGRASSDATEVVVAEPSDAAPSNTALPKVSGTAEEGQTLTATEGSWTGSPTSYAYEWEDCNTSGEACSEISGATASSYKLASSDVGHVVRVVVTATNANGSGKASAEPTATVTAHAAGSQIYVAQAGAGGETGESCASAHSLSWLNSESNWGPGAGKVAPGTTVDLCGTLTQAIETQASGEAGKPITISFTSGSKIAMAGNGCPGSGCISVAEGSKYLTITSAAGYKGQIENTERSYEREKAAGPTTKAILAEGCKHCAFENLEIGPLYISEKGDVVLDTEIDGIETYNEGGEPEYITVKNDYFHDLGWAVGIQNGAHSGHIYVEHNTFYHLTHGAVFGAKLTGSSSIGEETFAHNRFYGNRNWEDPIEDDTNHVDGVHCFAEEAHLAHYTGLYIYDNYITTEGGETTGPIFIEGSNAHTPCSDKTSNIWIFNNVLTGNTCCGLAGALAGEVHTYNNTEIGEGETEHQGAKETCERWTSDTKEGRTLTIGKRFFKNNVVSTCGYMISAERFLAEADGMEHNLWAKASNNNEAFVCEQGEAESGPGEDREHWATGEFSDWVNCMEQPEAGSKYEATAKLNETGEARAPLGEPESSSYAIGHAENLSSLCAQTPEGALCENINGEARPSSGAWNIGAY